MIYMVNTININSLYFIEYRSEWSNIFRLATMLNPGVAFQFANQWLQSILSKPINTGKGMYVQ